MEEFKLTIDQESVNIYIDNGILYPIIHIEEGDLEFAFTHAAKQYGEEYYSFVNGQHTTQGGTHQSAFREAIVKTVRDFYKKDYDASDIRQSIVATISIKIQYGQFVLVFITNNCICCSKINT